MNELLSDVVNYINIYNKYYEMNSMIIYEETKLRDVIYFVKNAIPEETLNQIKTELKIS